MLDVIDYDKSFFFIASKPYDRDLDILNSSDFKFNASIRRNIEPELVKILDIQIMKSCIETGKGKMKILV